MNAQVKALMAAAADNARARFVVGWPLLLLAVGFYAPADGLSRLLLVAAGALLAVRAVPGHPPVRSRSTAKVVSPSTAKSAPPTAPKSGSPTGKKPAPGRVPSRRGREGGERGE